MCGISQNVSAGVDIPSTKAPIIPAKTNIFFITLAYLINLRFVKLVCEACSALRRRRGFEADNRTIHDGEPHHLARPVDSTKPGEIRPGVVNRSDGSAFQYEAVRVILLIGIPSRNHVPIVDSDW